MRDGSDAQVAFAPPLRWRTPPPRRPDRAPTFELAVLAVLVVWNVAANLVVPDALEVPASLIGAGLLVFMARRAGAEWDTLGLAREQVRSGARVGGIAAAVIAASVLLVALIPASRETFADERFVGMGIAEALYDALVRIPLATALGEEVAFRGVVLGLLLLWMSPLRAMLLSSLVFGLWHILPAMDALDTTAVDVGGGAVVETGAVLGQVLITSLAGLAFSWLRLRGRHVIAPVLAHWALNGTAFVAGWLVVRNGW